MNLIEEIKSKINIVDLAFQLGLEPTKNDFIFSIYKPEKNRSLKLYRKTNSFYDFSTGTPGDVINLYAAIKKIENEEAIKVLAEDLGLTTNNKIAKFQDYKIDGRKMKEIQKMSIKIYHSLENFCNGVNEKALQYLKGPKRGLTEETINRFRLFSITDISKTIDHLLSNYGIEELMASGLLNEKGRFVFSNHRLIIPYLDSNKIVYLRGRIISENADEINKYIGLTGQPAKRLFNLDAIKNLNEGFEILICEGEFDTMIAEQNGYKAVGVPGVNNYPDNIKEMLNNYEPILCFDNDKSGKEGMQTITNKIEKKITGIFFKQHNDITEYFCLTNAEKLNRNGIIDYRILEPERKSNFKPLTAEELQKLVIPPMEWIVDGMIPEGLINCSGRPKCGKSWLALGMALSVCSESLVLNKFKSKKCGVLYIALEDSRRRMQSRINNILAAEYEKTFPKNLYLLHIDDEFPKLNDGGLEALNELLEDYPDVKLIIIDTFGRAIKDTNKGKGNIYLAEYDMVSAIQKFAIEKRIAILLIHHTKKGKEDYVFDEISGTTGITGPLDAMMMIRRSKGKTMLCITGREVAEAEYQIEFDKNSFTWKIIEEKEENVNKVKTAERQEIIELFKKYKRKMKASEVAQLLDKRLSNVSHLIKKLVDAGLLESPAYGIYKLKENDPGKTNSEEFFN